MAFNTPWSQPTLNNGDPLGSDGLNYIQTNFPNCMDKRGDNFSGSVTISSGNLTFVSSNTSGNVDFSVSSGTFNTTLGPNNLNGPVVITGTNIFTTGTGAVTVKGNTTFAVGKTVTMSGPVTINGTYTLNASGACLINSNGTLTVDSPTLSIGPLSATSLAIGNSACSTTIAGVTSLSFTNNPSNTINFGNGTGPTGMTGQLVITASGSTITAGTNTAINSTTAFGIMSTAQQGISTVHAGGITSGVTGGISLVGGTSDWVTFTSDGTTAQPRSYSKAHPFIAGYTTGVWTPYTSGSLLGGATTDTQTAPITMVHNGATISSVDVYIKVVSHTGVPTNGPTVLVDRLNLTTGAVTYLSTTAPQSWATSPALIAVPATGAAWYNGGAVQKLHFTCNQNNVVDSTQYTYNIILEDENGTNSASGNIYLGYVINYSGISNSQFA